MAKLPTRPSKTADRAPVQPVSSAFRAAYAFRGRAAAPASSPPALSPLSPLSPEAALRRAALLGHTLEQRTTGTAADTAEPVTARQNEPPPAPMAHDPLRRAALLGHRVAEVGSRQVQRQVLGQTGVTRYIDPAAVHAAGGTSLGFTPPWLNDAILSDDSTADDVRNAIRTPTLAVLPASAGGFDAKVSSVPTNYVGYRMKVLMPGPWSAQANKAYWVAVFNAQERFPGANGTITLVIHGDPNDATLESEVEAHEQHHADDIVRIARAVLYRWDAALTQAARAGTTYHGDAPETAIAALYHAMGGTPDQIGTALFDRWDQSSRAFHESDAGKVRMINEKTGINDAGTRVTITYKLP